jgi:hypothetical protein
MKIPLKTKIFYWYLRRGVILTKDNLVKRNWYGNHRCIFCHQDETINIYFSSVALPDLYGQSSKQLPACIHRLVLPMFLGIGFMGIDLRFRKLIRMRVLAVIWSLWLCRNDKVFDDKNYSLLQVVYR